FLVGEPDLLLAALLRQHLARGMELVGPSVHPRIFPRAVLPQRGAHARRRARRKLMRNGLVTESLAPDSSPRMVSASESAAVSMITGARTPWRRISLESSRPSTSGRPISRRMAS